MKHEYVNSCRIWYSLHAKIDDLEGQVIINNLHENIEHSHRVNILCPYFCTPFYDQKALVEKAVRNWWFRSQGTCSVKCILKKDVLLPGEHIEL